LVGNLPIEILYINKNKRIEIIPEQRLILKSSHTTENKYQEIKLPLSNKNDSLTLSSDSLEVYYSVLGLNEIRKVVIFPKVMEQSDFERLNPTKQPSNIDEFDFLTVDDKNKTIEFSKAMCSLNRDLIIPKDYIVTAKPGCLIDLVNSARIISYSPVMFFGRNDSVISVTSSDLTGQGMIVFNCDKTSELNHVRFSNLSNISDFGWGMTGALTFYESSVNINNCVFINNLRGDDYLNIIRANFKIINTTFEDTYADAFDADFCYGSIRNTAFINIGNDAVDISGSKLHIKETEIINPADKGLSAGEGSHLICEDIKIEGGEIAVASKDNSTIEINKLSIQLCKLAYVAFQKKSEYGPGIIIVDDVHKKNVGKEYLVETSSTLTINGEQIKDKTPNVRGMLYGEEYGKSSKK
jgi:hypothetical protein